MSEPPTKSDDPAAQLAEIRAKRAALAESRRIREAERAVADALAEEKQRLADDEAIEAAEAEYGPVGKKIAAVRTDAGVVILKRAHPAMFKRFQDKGSLKHEDLDRLVRHCLVHPLPDVFDRLLDELPATMLRCADAVSFLAGVRAQDVAEK